MKQIKFSSTELNTDHLFQVIGTDNIDTYLNKLIEQDIEKNNKEEFIINKKIEAVKFLRPDLSIEECSEIVIRNLEIYKRM